MRNMLRGVTPHGVWLWLLTGGLLAAATVVQAGSKDDPLLSSLRVTQLEARDGEDGNPGVLEADAWLGYDLQKLWLKVDAERVAGITEEAQVQALYSRAVAPFWDLQLGLRKDFQPTPDRSWAVLGVQGMAPYRFEIDAALFLGESGRTGLRLNVEYELLLTQRLILTPEAELNLYGQNDEAVGAGAGLSASEIGLRLRYEIRREFAPYMGVNWSKKYGTTADYAKAEGEATDDWQWVVGVRFWF
ncbi:copper resistance protein B [Aestuariicella hydrocarbonica]|uniref:Copper resistance protein B n=1 Tax=Pseudomaricurvus hydrocarbonicus TaxID=1470433 RepID=A0A9E5JUU1_9GAMM|nr:copper resistance protein B [Aestuariicella hydrocarbonica]NHO64980.1 copper resistance protein B [Aestuariicella hydrocarbonica]